ncbi:hypothetical protein Salat_2128200 [Sesamum alatum]|uniref:Uncharacterized protein n=1 Tax=Sesamum alatum TaxID=300844 RepID=A0AAE2CGV6_9LAMI|nr:hypothetical protein Salat_2128200 [Sesamum alatum]
MNIVEWPAPLQALPWHPPADSNASQDDLHQSLLSSMQKSSTVHDHRIVQFRPSGVVGVVPQVQVGPKPTTEDLHASCAYEEDPVPQPREPGIFVDVGAAKGVSSLSVDLSNSAPSSFAAESLPSPPVAPSDAVFDVGGLRLS